MGERMKISDEMVEKAAEVVYATKSRLYPASHWSGADLERNRARSVAKAVLESVLSDPREVAELLGGQVVKTVIDRLGRIVLVLPSKALDNLGTYIVIGPIEEKE